MSRPLAMPHPLPLGGPDERAGRGEARHFHELRGLNDSRPFRDHPAVEILRACGFYPAAILKAPRHRYLRAFVEWLTERRDSLPFRLHRVQTRKRLLVYRINGYPAELEVVVCPGEVMVTVTQGGELWDILACFESAAVKTEHAYRCHQCPHDQGAHWPTRQALWRAHDFEPLAEWLRSKLCAAKRLELHQVSGATWAALCSLPVAEFSASSINVLMLPESAGVGQFII